MSKCLGLHVVMGHGWNEQRHCTGCADDEHSWLPREYAEKVRENTHLRVQLEQRTAALQALRDWVDDEEPGTALDALIAQADRALADLPDA